MNQQLNRCVDVKELRKCATDAGFYNINDIANATGINRNTIGKILSCKIYPSSYVMSKLVDELHIPLDRAGKIFFADKLA